MLFLESFTPAVFGYYVLWLLDAPLFPYVDLSRPFKGFDATMFTLIYNIPTHVHHPEITMLTMSDESLDNDPSTTGESRRLVFAYFLGQNIGDVHFQDAIMNTIIKYFRANHPPPVSFVTNVYQNSAIGRVSGLQKFLIDYYIWACVPPEEGRLPYICDFANVDPSQVPPLSAYPAAFRQQVTATLKDNVTQDIVDPGALLRPQVPVVAWALINRTEPRGAVVDFAGLQAFLCNARQGTLKCRYHHHSRNQPCHNMLVDDTPVAGPVNPGTRNLALFVSPSQ